MKPMKKNQSRDVSLESSRITPIQYLSLTSAQKSNKMLHEKLVKEIDKAVISLGFI